MKHHVILLQIFSNDMLEAHHTCNYFLELLMCLNYSSLISSVTFSLLKLYYEMKFLKMQCLANFVI